MLALLGQRQKRIPSLDGSADEATLIQKAKRGDAEAFGRLAERHSSRLLNVARAFLGSDAGAWDAVQEAFVAAWRNLDRFEGRSSFYTWARSIVINVCRMERRRRARRGVVISLDSARRIAEPGAEEMAWDVPDPAPGPDRLVEQKAFYTAFMRALDSLPPYYSEVFWLRESEKMSYQDIAEQLGINIGTVRSRLATARRLLRERMNADGWAGGDS